MGSSSLLPKQFHVRKVAVVGAGPSGLAAVKYLKAHATFETIVVFEQQDQVGGVWNYSKLASKECPVPQQDPFYPPDPPILPGHSSAPIFPSPLYDALHANIPASLMRYSDQTFPKESWIFPSRESIKQYLVDYAEDVKSFIKFSFQVKQITHSLAGGRDQWTVEAKSTVDNERTCDTFDAVVMANGHYSVPFIPEIKNIGRFHKTYPSVITHSKQYRTSQPFKGKKVVIVANGPSGTDIARQINQVSGGQSMLSVRHPTSPDKLAHTGCEEIAEIEEFLLDGQGVRLKDGRVETDIDAVVFCTGFLFSYPFLHDLQKELITAGRGVHGLYKHIFCVQHPTLVFPGLNTQVVPWPLSEAQAAVFSAVWSNNLSLPSVEEMEQWSRELYQRKGEVLHLLPPPSDGYYVNELHDWVRSATLAGKKPPHWDDELFWERSICPVAKLAFEQQGSRATTLEELGFHYDAKKYSCPSNII